MPCDYKKMAKGGVITQDAEDLADLAASGVGIAADPEMMQAGLTDAQETKDANDLADIASSGVPLAADPELIKAALQNVRMTQDANDLSDIASSGVPVAADPSMILEALKAKGAGMADGGVVEAEEAKPGQVEIPEDVKEYIESLHKKRLESRPDEGWHIARAEKEEQIVPYKQDEEAVEAAAEDTADASLTEMGVPGMATGGVVPDRNKLLADIAPLGTGVLTPSPAMDAPMPPEAPQMAAAPAPIVPRGTIPAPADPTEDDFLAKANEKLGGDQQEQAAFMKGLGDKSLKGQAGAALAGIGDAIAQGATLGKVNPGNADRSQGIIKEKESAGLTGMQTMRGNQEKAVDLSQKLQAQDPKSPLSRYAQKAYASLGKKIGIDLTKASASMIADIAGKGVEALASDYNNELKKQGLDLQKQTLAATIANQKAELQSKEEGKQLDAAKVLANRGPLATITGMIPGTATSKGTDILKRQAAGLPPTEGPTKINSQAEYDALPPGAHYVDSYGTQKVKK